ncbi:MAG TPA: glycosyltransferase family 4 protein [Terriglobales bacterium]|nr:glycosyltransferase family 4 protein [Terriglobales bacterium]
MRVLWVKGGKLLPVDTGGKIRSFNILRRLSQDHEVTLISYYGGQRDPDYEAALPQQFLRSQVVYTAATDSDGFRGVLDYVYRLPRLAPYSVTKFTHPAVRRLIASELSGGRFEVAICDFLAASLNFPEKLPIPCALFQHNVESALWRRMAATESHPLRKLSYSLEAARMSRYERRTLGRFHHIIAVSEHDRQQLLEMDPGCEITVVPTGVDTQKFQVAPPSSATPPRIVFTGSMDWEPNIDAVEYFCGQIWPRILAEFPDAIFQIVGRNPFAKVQRLASKSVQVTGTVPSVMEYLRDATVVVVPLRIGGGTRLKIYEAMAMGKALVSTTIGAEGLDFHEGRDLLLADDASSFAEAVLLLVRDAEVRRKFEQSAVQLAAQFDWSVVAGQFAEVLRRIASGTSAGRRANHLVPVDR